MKLFMLPVQAMSCFGCGFVRPELPKLVIIPMQVPHLTLQGHQSYKAPIQRSSRMPNICPVHQANPLSTAGGSHCAPCQLLSVLCRIDSQAESSLQHSHAIAGTKVSAEQVCGCNSLAGPDLQVLLMAPATFE